jgi:hypothetical protein
MPSRMLAEPMGMPSWSLTPWLRTPRPKTEARLGHQRDAQPEPDEADQQAWQASHGGRRQAPRCLEHDPEKWRPVSEKIMLRQCGRQG